MILAILLISSSIFAASSMASVGMIGGYSDAGSGYGLMGFNTSAQYLADISNKAGVGLGSHIDLGFGLRDGLSFMFGIIVGPGFEFRLTPEQAINITIGPGLVMEAGRGYDSLAFGIGIDALYTFYLDEDRTLGFSVGGTFYPEFIIDDESRPDASFGFTAVGYVGLTWRTRGFAEDPLDLDPLGYVILREGI